QSAAAALPAVGLPALPGVTPASLLAMAAAAGPPVASVHTRIRSHRGVYPLT
ncbi:hypothetical protein W005_02098, partial [Mycobacterium tuberculosis TB_RSA95]